MHICRDDHWKARNNRTMHVDMNCLFIGPYSLLNEMVKSLNWSRYSGKSMLWVFCVLELWHLITSRGSSTAR